MKRLFLFLIFACLSILCNVRVPRAEEKALPIAEEKVITNIRRSLSVPPGFTIKILDLRNSPLPGLWQGTLELRLDANQARKENIFISTDSRYYFIGNLYDVEVDMDLLRRNMVNVLQSPSKGNPNAPVTIVEYSDFQCESCKAAHDALMNEKIIEGYGDKVRFIYKNFPVTRSHKWATQASVAALCAQEQNPTAFWKFHDGLFARQNEIVEGNLREKAVLIAKESGLDLKRFEPCFDQKATLPGVNADIQEGQTLGIYSTPTFLINGRVLIGFHGTPEFKQLVDQFLPPQKK